MSIPHQPGWCFAVGDLVIAAKGLHEGPTEELPAQDYCRKGDTLEIREVRPNGWYVAAHPHREKGAGFLIKHQELEPTLALAAPEN